MVIKFGDHQVPVIEGFAAYQLANFIADCGGLLGLFLGFSFTAILNSIKSKYVKQNLKDVDNQSSRIDREESEVPHVRRIFLKHR